jgi:PAS domain S-box-containing protein
MIPFVSWPAGSGRRALESVQRLRLVLPIAIFLFVVVQQAWETRVVDSWPAPLRFAEGVLFYGLVGPLVTFWTLDWIARAIVAGEAVEARARQGERDLASITSLSADAIFSLDTADVIQSWNRGAEEILGYGAGEATGQHAAMLLPERERQRGELALIRDRLLAEGSLRAFQTERRRRDGVTVPVELTQTLLRGEDGRFTGSSVILRDITERLASEAAIRELNRDLEARVAARTAELGAVTEALRATNAELLAANAELTQLDALKDEFVSLVSHELRAPLTNINASVELALAAAPPPALEAKLAIIGQEAQRLTRLVKSVLDVSRIQAGRLVVLPAPAEPAALLRAALAGQPQDRPWSLDVAAETPQVLADVDRVAEVLANLLDNAVKYSAPGLPVALAARPLGPGEVLFSVTDRGVGIPPEELARVFERFHRVERHDARATYGHGLGLYIAQRLVEAQGGRMWAESVPGAGSTFLFTLPVAPEEP